MSFSDIDDEDFQRDRALLQGEDPPRPRRANAPGRARRKRAADPAWLTRPTNIELVAGTVFVAMCVGGGLISWLWTVGVALALLFLSYKRAEWTHRR